MNVSQISNLFFCLMFIVLILLINTRPVSAEFKIAGNGKANVVIVREPNASEAETKAATELAGVLEQVTGAKFSIQTAVSNVPASAIIVGRGDLARKAFPEIDFDRLEPEQIVIQTKGQQLLLSGGSFAATLTAVYKFLQDYVGCRWWTPWATDIPHKAELLVPEINLTDKPIFEMRMVGSLYALDDKEWQARNFLNDCNCSGWVHTFYDLVPPEPNYKDHPEWYSLVSGKRAYGAQLCLSNKELRDFVTRQVENKIRENPDARSISVSQMDWGGACECDNCRALVKKYGSQSGALIDFLNDVAAKVKVDYPNARLQTIAYGYTLEPPIGIKADQQIIVQYCPMDFDHSAALNAPGNAAFDRQLTNWNDVTGNLYLWDYPTNLVYYPLPHPNWFLIGPNLRLFRERGVKGIFEQGAFSSNGAEMAELRNWLYSRLLWNPNQDDSALIDEFLNGYYGREAAPFIRQYLELMAQNNQNSALTPFPDSENASFLKFEPLSQAEEIFKKAEVAAQNDKDKLWRVQQARHSVQFAFLLRWDQLQAEAKTLNKPWPFDISREKFADLWLAAVMDDDGPKGWTKPTRLGEMSALNPAVINRLLNPPPPPIETRENFFGSWLRGWFQCPTFLLWLGLMPLLLPIFLRQSSGLSVKGEFRGLGILALITFIAALAIYSWWQPFWTGKRILILFVPLAISIFFSFLRLFAAEYRKCLQKLIAAQLFAVALAGLGLGLWLKPFFIARYNGYNTVLGSVNFNRANFYTLNLQGADLEGSTLRQTYFRGSWLGFANLRNSDLRNADLRYTTLNHTLFDNSDLRGADLRGAGINESSFKGAKYNGRTLFPAGFEPKEFGAVFEE